MRMEGPGPEERSNLGRQRRLRNGPVAKLAGRSVQASRSDSRTWHAAAVSTAGRLTTHVLDVARGRPAQGVAVAVFGLAEGVREPLAAAMTNADGRTDAPLVHPGALRAQTYELEFSVGTYLAACGAATPTFLNVVPVRFAVTDPDADHHVPLLLTPWSYSTYRGS